MMDLSWAWLVGLLITHVVAYYIGHRDGQAREQPLSEEARIELKKYEIDKQYAYLARQEERSGKHDN